jgi:quercetin dioxygenase-like cupin family protein
MPNDQIVVRVEDIPTFEPAPGATLRMLAGEDHGLGLCLIAASYPPGAWNRSHRHPNASAIVVCEGRGLFKVDDDEVEAGPGDVVLVPAMAWHSFGNIGDDWLRVVGADEGARHDAELAPADSAP